MKYLFKTAFANRLVFAGLIAASVAASQTLPDSNNSTWSPGQGPTPLALAPGAPAGVYDLSGFEHINLYNGHLNFALPLATISGRGEAGFPLTLTIDKPQWSITMTPESTLLSGGGNGNSPIATVNYTANLGVWWNPYAPGYGPGILIYKRTSDGLTYCSANGISMYGNTFGHFVFVSGDGTETPLYAAEPGGGIPATTRTCDAIGANTARGPVFLSQDGSIAFYQSGGGVSDLINASDITQFPLGASTGDSSGRLILKNGTQYKIALGLVNQIVDRNGNTTALVYNGAGNALTQVTDSLGRNTTIDYFVTVPNVCASQSPTGDECDRITLRSNGPTSEQRVIYVIRKDITTAIRPDLVGANQLFPLGGGTDQIGRVPTEVILPNGTTYNFAYSRFGELARVILPTGGAIDYDYAAGLSNAGSDPILDTSGQVITKWDTSAHDFGSAGELSPPIFMPFIYRRLVTRRQYQQGVVILTSPPPAGDLTTTFALPETGVLNPGTVSGLSGITNLGYVDATQTAAGQPQAFERHYFYTGSSPFPYGAFSSALGPASALFQQTLNIVPQIPDLFEGKEYTTQTGSSAAAILRTSDRVWKYIGVQDAASPPGGLNQTIAGGAGDAQLCQEVTTLNDSGQVSGKSYRYDLTASGSAAALALGNLTDVYEYDFGTGQSISTFTTTTGATARNCPSSFTGYTRRTHTDFVTDDHYTNAVNYSIHPVRLRSLPAAQYTYQQTDSNEVARTTFTYDQTSCPSSDGFVSCPAGTSASGWTAPNGNQTTNGAGEPVRGNVTSVTRRAQYTPTTVDVTASTNYDALGNAVEHIDGNGNITSVNFADNFQGSQPAQATYAFPATITYPPANTGDPRFSAVTAYDYFLAKPVQVTDANGTVYTAAYNDQLDRVTGLTRGGLQATSYAYNDSGTITVTTKKDLYALNDQLLKTVQSYDGLGRPYQTIAGSGSTLITSSQTYDGFSRVTQKCTPHLSAQAFDTDGCEGYGFDSLGRTTTITRADTSQVTLSYTGSSVTTKDERKTTGSTTSSDGLGRLHTVTDDAGNLTTYSYDALDDLTGVAQGAQTRAFTYDGVKRLLTVTQPETTQIQYSYDNNGNPKQKTQVGVLYPTVTVNYAYDALNRLTGKTYSNATPPVSLCYDGRKFSGSACNTVAPVAGQKLRLTGVGNTSSGVLVASSDLTYDAVGRITQNIESIGSGVYAMHYAYNVNDSQASVQYASGRTVTTCYDNVFGRPIWASAVKHQSDCLASQATPGSATGYYGVVNGYFPPGQMQTMALGNGLTETWDYNNRQQAKSMQLSTANANCPGSGLNVLTLGYGFPAGLNNGNVQSQTITSLTAGCQQSTLTQTYSYDSLNRLTLVAESGGSNAWQEGYGYDQYGNVMTNPAQTNVQAPAFMPSVVGQIDATRNRVVKSTAGQTTNDVQYDDAGNVTMFPVMSGQMTYDAENRLTSFQTVSGSMATYAYDGQGRRVTKTAGGLTTYYVYGAGDELLAEYGGVANTASGTVYQTEDHLGSTRAVTDVVGRIVSRSDYLPFGETIAATATFNRGTLMGYGQAAGTSLTFTEHVGDAESALDYFGARYFAGAMGRFTSADSTFMTKTRIADPQQWNLYTYTRNNPLKYIDPDGHELKIAIRNDSNYSNEVIRHAAEHLAATYRAAGVKVITIEIQRGRVSDSENLISGLVKTDYLEIRRNGSGSGGFLGTQDIPSGERGHNFNFLGGLAAVDTSKIGSLTDDPEHAAVAISNLASHEIAHDAVGHPSGDPIMDPPDGADDPNWLFRANQFGPGVQKALQDKFNKPGEKPLTTIITKPDDKKDDK